MILFLQLQLLYDRRIPARVILLEIYEVRLTVGYHAEKAAPRVVVLLVLLKVVGQFADLLAQKSDLDFRRAGVLVMDARFLDDTGLLSRS